MTLIVSLEKTPQSTDCYRDKNTVDFAHIAIAVRVCLSPVQLREDVRPPRKKALSLRDLKGCEVLASGSVPRTTVAEVAKVKQ